MESMVIILVADCAEITRSMEMFLLQKYSGPRILNRSLGGEAALPSCPHYLYMAYSKGPQQLRMRTQNLAPRTVRSRALGDQGLEGWLRYR